MTNRFGNIVNEYYVKLFRLLHEKRVNVLENICSKEDAISYINQVKNTIRDCFNLNKIERCPLNIKITKTIEFKDYTLKTLYFDSLPDYPVTCNLYLPKNISTSSPGLLMLCGHNPEGKASVRGSLFCATLASFGFVVLSPDPISQGERYQYKDYNPNIDNVAGHNMVGKKLIALNEFFGSFRAFDAIRALDCLESFKEVNPKEIYVAGCSGGGTLTSFVAALDDRPKGIIPSCYITKWLSNIENELPVDAEQIPPNLASYGMDMGDFLIAAAPKDLLILDEKNDFFDVRGTVKTFDEIKKIYTLLHCEDKVDYFFGPNGHGFHEEQRYKAYEFLTKISSIKSVISEKNVTPPTSEQMQVTQSGQLLGEYPNCRHVLSLVKEKAVLTLSQTGNLSRDQLKKQLISSLKINESILEKSYVPNYRILRPNSIENYTLSAFLIEDKDKVSGLLQCWNKDYFFYVPESKKALLYIPHNDGKEVLQLKEFNCQNYDKIYTFEPWGIGAFTPNSCDWHNRNFGSAYNFDYHFSSIAMLAGSTYIGKQVEGILQAVKLLKANGTREIVIAGKVQGALLASLVAFLDIENISLAILIDTLKSYMSSIDKTSIWPQSAIVPGILTYADLPDIYQQIDCEIRGYFNDVFDKDGNFTHG